MSVPTSHEPRVGVYALDENLESILQDHYDHLNNHHIFFDYITMPLDALKIQYESGVWNEYVLRERYRLIVQNLRDEVGQWIKAPSWRELIDNERWADACGLTSMVLDQKPDWTVYSDNLNSLYDAIEKTPSMAEGSLQELLESVDTRGVRTLKVVSLEMQRVYVVRSKSIEGCSDVSTSHNGFHALENIGDGMRPGPHPTYVLEEAVVKDYFELINSIEEEEAC